MSADDSAAEIRELLAAHRDGELTAEQLVRLQEQLKSDPAARRAFVQEQLLDAAFHLETPGNLQAASVVHPVADTRRAETEARPRSMGRWAIAAGLLFLLGLGLGGVLKKRPVPSVAEGAEPLDDGIALLAQSVEAVWSGDVQPRTGSILSAGKLRLTSGLAQIEFYSGARLILDGPVDLELVSSNQAICRSGRLRALVPPAARGFSVISPRFELIDLGTEFGMDVRPSGDAHVQVFDGEVKLYPADGKRSPERSQRLLGGAGASWLASGTRADLATDPGSFPSFADVRSRTESRARLHLAAWRDWNRSLAGDPRIAVRYDFESAARTLQDSGSAEAHGSIIGCEWTNGRWSEKGALEFKRPSDRVRVNIPGEFDTLTLTAWIRVDASPDRLQALLLTDGFEVGRPHWQISPAGELRMGIRTPSATPKVGATGYGSSVLFKPRQIGVWSFVATVYDRHAGMVRHYLNDREVSAEAIRFDQPLRIGSAEIGNWGVPLKNSKQPVRNFVGRMDELTVWKVALTGDELQAMNQKGRP